MSPELAWQIIAHHLRIFGVDDAGVNDIHNTPARLLLMVAPSATDAVKTQAFAANGGVAIAVLPEAAFCGAFGVTQMPAASQVPAILAYRNDVQPHWARLRTLHPHLVFHHAASLVVVADQANQAVWLWLPVGDGGILFVGTALAEDLIRYRQGDPAKEKSRPVDPIWGIPGERPLYLFEEQIQGEEPAERHADNWAMALAQFVANRLHKPLLPILPGNAPGAVIITGDDDQAYLEKYDEQLKLLGETPITYFLHPLTRHTPGTVKTTLRKPWIDLGIHPDALDAPTRYGALLKEQSAWFKRLTGEPAISLRNHGFLNDGYWKHLPHWIKAGIKISSNLPGMDGRVLNGSLLPARLAYNGSLTDHWSLLTAFGDGMVFALNKSDADAADRIRGLANQIVANGIPGIIVLNLHPQNISETRKMHHAVLEIIDAGFHPWTIKECLTWFCHRDGQIISNPTKKTHGGILDRLKKCLSR